MAVFGKGVQAGHYTCDFGMTAGEYYCVDPSMGQTNAIGRATSLSYCQEWQDDSQYNNQTGSGVVTFVGKGPRGNTCTWHQKFNGTNDSWSGDCTQVNLEMAVDNNVNECSKCNGISVPATNWNYTEKSTIINSVVASNWKPTLYIYSSWDGNKPGSDNTIKLPPAYPNGGVDFRFRVLEFNPVTNTTSTVLGTRAIWMGDMTRQWPADANGNITIIDNGPMVSCTYYRTENTAPVTSMVNYNSRNNLAHKVTCNLTNMKITNINYVPGRTYTIQTWTKPAYGDETAWINYTADENGVNQNICRAQYTAPQNTPTPTPTKTPTPTLTPTKTPTPTPPPALQCKSLTHLVGEPPQMWGKVSLTCNAASNGATPHHYNFRYTSNGGQVWTYINNVPPSSRAYVATANYTIQSYGHFTNQCQVCRQYIDPIDNSVNNECTPWGQANVTLPPPVTAIPPTITTVPNTPVPPTSSVTSCSSCGYLTLSQAQGQCVKSCGGIGNCSMYNTTCGNNSQCYSSTRCLSQPKLTPILVE
jgi:hypothetical protein